MCHVLKNKYNKIKMTVNPNLATLMRIIEENMDKINEGEYLDAMNALGALHQNVSSIDSVIPSGHPPSYNIHSAISILGENGYRCWFRVINNIPDYENIQPEDWNQLSETEQNRLNRLSTLVMAQSYHEIISNPNPIVCPFIARHSVGHWSYGNEDSTWKCVCGYSGKSKHWKKHEESERHKEWAEHRIVPKRMIRQFCKEIKHYENGILIYYNYPLSGGVRYFPVRQEKNEWTHPELFSYNNENWFVVPRDNNKFSED